MTKIYPVIVLALLACCIFACKKGGNSKPNDQSSNLLVGKWLVNKEEVKVYTTGGTLVKDSTWVFANQLFDLAWYEIYNQDGSGYVTSRPYKRVGSDELYTDTTSVFTYKISGNSLDLFEYGALTSNEHYKMLSLNSTSMSNETSYTDFPNSNWGLDMNTKYTFTEDCYYTKQ